MGNQHNFQWDTSKAYFSVVSPTDSGWIISVPYMRIFGIQGKVDDLGSRAGIFILTGSSAANIMIDSCLGIGVTSTTPNLVYGAYQASPIGGANTVQNCLFYDCGASGITFGANQPGNSYNNGVINCGNNWANALASGINTVTASGGSNIKNNYVLNTGTVDCYKNSGGQAATATNNYASDSTATLGSWTTTGCVNNVSTTGQVTSLTSNWVSVPSGSFFRTGVDLSSLFTWDGAGNGRSTPFWVGPSQPPLQTTTTLISSLNPSFQGGAIKLSATIFGAFGTATGTVTFYDTGVSIGSGTLLNGSINLVNEVMTTGTHILTAVYSGNSVYAPSTSSPINQVIYPKPFSGGTQRDMENYKGMEVPAKVVNLAGQQIKENFMSLVDWHPRSVWNETRDPCATDDETANFYPGSFWLNTVNSKLWICQSSSVGAVVWRQLALVI